MNLLDAGSVIAGAREVTKGAVFPLDLPLGSMPDGLLGRSAPRHTVEEQMGGVIFDDYIDNLWLQGSSQWDALGHVRHPQAGFYNGVQDDQRHELGIDAVARRGIAGRGVLLDIERHVRETRGTLDPQATTVIDVETLDACAGAQKVEILAGDILVIRTGWLRWFLNEATDQQRTKILEDAAATPAPGLGGPGMVEYLWDHRISAVASDNIAVESMPPSAMPLHLILIPLFGLHLGELWWLEDLAADCADDGRYSFQLTSAPLHLRGGVGSPANALAIK
jgi:kynurenine formamidase